MRRSREDAGFAAIVSEAQKVLGHVLSSSDLKRLFGIYDYLALPPEVILMLLNHCVSISQGRRPSMRFIEKEAYVWANREIMSLEQAEEYIRSSRQRREELGRIKESLGIRGPGADGHGTEIHLLLAGYGLRARTASPWPTTRR